MKIITRKNKLTLPLILVTILIWGFIIYNIVEYFNPTDDNPIEVAPDAYSSPSPKKQTIKSMYEEKIEYVKLDRDPFLFSKVEPPKQKIVKPVKAVPKTSPLNYRISGIIINNKSKLVIFEDNTNNNTLFLHEGETYKDIKIKRIFDSKVELIEMGKLQVVTINQ